MELKSSTIIKPTSDVLIVTLLTVGCIVVSLIVLMYLLPGSYFSSYPFIPLFFYGYALITRFLANKAIKSLSSKKVLYVFLLAKTMKIVLSMIILFIIIFAFKENAKAFSLIFMSFYMVFLVYDTWFFSKLKKK